MTDKARNWYDSARAVVARNWYNSARAVVAQLALQFLSSHILPPEVVHVAAADSS